MGDVVDSETVYRLYGVNRNLLYVGVTRDVDQRLRHHRVTKGWWDSVASVEVEKFSTRREAERAEAVAILTECPEHNRRVSVRASASPTGDAEAKVSDDIVSHEQVATELGIEPQSVRSTLRRYGHTEVRGYRRADVEDVKARRRGARTDQTREEQP